MYEAIAILGTWCPTILAIIGAPYGMLSIYIYIYMYTCPGPVAGTLHTGTCSLSFSGTTAAYSGHGRTLLGPAYLTWGLAGRYHVATWSLLCVAL